MDRLNLRVNSRKFRKVITAANDLRMPPASILLVDDDRELNEMLIEYLSAEAFRVVAAPDGAAALQQLGRGKFDLVILDVMLPALSGFDVLRRVRETLSVPVIMLTARGDDADRILGFDLGADDYLPKPFNPKELLARARAVLRRSGAEANSLASDIVVGRLRLDRTILDASIDGSSLRLTAAEFRLLEMLMRSPRQALSRERLTERVLGRRLLPDDRSIDTHISNLRRKLGAQGDSGIEIRSIRGAGYLLTGTGEFQSCRLPARGASAGITYCVVEQFHPDECLLWDKGVRSTGRLPCPDDPRSHHSSGCG